RSSRATAATPRRSSAVSGRPGSTSTRSPRSSRRTAPQPSSNRGRTSSPASRRSPRPCGRRGERGGAHPAPARGRGLEGTRGAPRGESGAREPGGRLAVPRQLHQLAHPALPAPGGSMSAARRDLLLAADVGATKTNLALYTVAGGALTAVGDAHLVNERYAGLGDVVRAFLKDRSELPSAACFGIAGPVADGRSRMPNLGWL